MDAWLTRLLTTLQSEAAHSEQTRLALENIVIGGPIVTEEAPQPTEADAPAPQPPSVPRDLPKDAAHRLEELEHGLFTSDLSVNEFLLVKEAGFHPLGFVMGSSIYHIGIQTRKWGAEPGADQADRGHVHRPRAGHEPDGGGGPGARRRRRRRRAPRRQLLRVGQRLGRVHRLRHGGQGRGRDLVPQRRRASRSPRTSRVRTSGP